MLMIDGMIEHGWYMMIEYDDDWEVKVVRGT